MINRIRAYFKRADFLSNKSPSERLMRLNCSPSHGSSKYDGDFIGGVMANLQKAIDEVDEINSRLTKIILKEVRIVVHCECCGAELTKEEIRSALKNNIKIDEISCNKCWEEWKQEREEEWN